MYKNSLSTASNVIGFLVFVLVSEAAGAIGAIYTTPAIKTWYVGLTKPSFNPPNWLFGPVWTTLFLIMGIGAFLVWRHGLSNKGVKLALMLFIIQLALNIMWSVIFFGLHAPLAAFIEIIVLWLMIAATAVYFYKVSVPAGVLMLPYILWVGFAAVLNFSIYALNK